METVVHDQEKIAKATQDGKTNAYDMETILQAALYNIVPGAFEQQLEIKRNIELVPTYLKVEKNFDPIPWIDTSKAVFVEISSLIITQPGMIYKEATRLAKAGFAQDEILPALSACIYQGKKEKEVGGEGFVRKESFLLTFIRAEDDYGMLVTTMDRTGQLIYSLSTEIPVNMSQRHQHAHFKSALIALVKKLPREPNHSILEFDYEISRTTKLNLFICLK